MALPENLEKRRRLVPESEILRPHKEIILERPLAPIINEIEVAAVWTPVFATGNPEKVREIEAILGQPIKSVDLSVAEIQDDDPIRVAEMKAIAAWEKFGRQPIIVEDTSLQLVGVSFLPGPMDKYWAGNPEMKSDLCDYLTTKKADRRAIAQVTLAIFDGKFVHTRVGQATGVIAEVPRGAYAWDWDDIFVADGQEVLENFDGKPRTFAEMTLTEKNQLSPRGKACQAWKEYPVRIGQYIYMLPEPYPMQLDAIKIEELAKYPQALQHAYNLSIFEDNTPQPDLTPPKIRRYQVSEIGEGKDVLRYTTDINSPDQGLIVTPIDKAVDFNGRPIRLALDNNDNPIFRQMGPEAIKMALASRAYEFILHHNEEMYTMLRQMMAGELQTPPRSNFDSPVIDQLIQLVKFEDGILRGINPEQADNIIDEAIEVIMTSVGSQLGYARQYSDRDDLSRKSAADRGLIVTTSGIPSALYSLGDMPPVTGWRDVLTTGALSYMDCYIPHNGIFVDKKRALRLFISARDDIYKLDLPRDITDLVIAHIGLSVGTDKPQELREFVKETHQEGCRLWRIHTTNPGRQVIDSAEIIRQEVQEGSRIGVHPLVDLIQALQLIQANIRINILFPGHGAGENCSSLLGGGAANSLELAYLLSRIPDFNSTAIGLDGGTGPNVGAFLGFIDNIVVHRRGVAGGIECGGLFVQHAAGRVVQPYHGTASAVTQWLEAIIDEEVAKNRLDLAGRLTNVEGVPNYMAKHRVVNSNGDMWLELRRLAGTALADQGCLSMAELREKISREGRYPNFRIVTPEAWTIAQPHRPK